jgi:hypothetical protein
MKKIFIFTLLLFSSFAQVIAQDTFVYEAKVGKSPAKFTLTWQGDGTVSGSYFHPTNPNQVYTLSGTNYEEGKLELVEYTQRKQTATISLEKIMLNGVVAWKGTMYNTDGRTFDIVLARKL